MPLGLLFPVDGALPSLEEELGRRTGACVHHLSAELVAINRGVTATLERQFAALKEVYRGLKLLVALAALLMGRVRVGWVMSVRG